MAWLLGFLFVAFFLFMTGLLLSIEFGCNILTIWFRHELSRAEFVCMLDTIFNDPKLDVSEYHVRGGGYDCWIANSYYGFSVNQVKAFTPVQKWMFFKRFKQWKREQYLAKGDRLHKDKLASTVFDRQLDSILEEENDKVDN